MNKLKYIFVALIATIFVACGDDSGVSLKAQKIHFNRDVCIRCAMMVSDESFAAEVVNPTNGKAIMFDDIGCVIKWFKENKISWQDKAAIYVSDEKTKKLIDARKAYYVSGRVTPMNFGFGANEKPQKGAVDYKTMSKAVLKMVEVQ